LKLTERWAPHDERCRCGTRIAVGAACFTFEGLPESLVGIFGDRSYCGPRCVRAELLEAMELLEGNASTELISDVHSVYSYLQSMFRIV
jgi:hypothetical protein